MSDVFDTLRVSHHWPEWASVEVECAGRVTVATALPGKGLYWNVVNNRRGWGCANGLDTTYSDTAGPCCCSPLQTDEVRRLLHSLASLIEFLESGTEVPPDPKAVGLTQVIDWPTNTKEEGMGDSE